MGPVFFLNLGTKIIVKPDILLVTLLPMLGFFVALFVGQILSAALAARFVPGGFTWAESWMIGFGMLGRAELFFVVLNVAYLDFPIFTEEMFFSLTMAAMLLNISVPITISLYKPYYVRNISETDAQPHLCPTASHTSCPIGKNAEEIVSAKANKAEHARQRRVFNGTMANEERMASRRSSESDSAHVIKKRVSEDTVITISSAPCMISKHISEDTILTHPFTPPTDSGGSQSA